MSIFNELLPKINEISNAFTKNFNEDLKIAFECFDKFQEEFQNGKNRAREKTQKDKTILTTLQSINEDDGETNKTPEEKTKNKTIASSVDNIEENTESSKETEPQKPKKRSKHEMDETSSPEQDKRQKRNASVKAQSIISKQDNQVNKALCENSIIVETAKKLVNVNLTQKLRREDSEDKGQLKSKQCGKDDDKENTEPMPLIQVKQEKISLPPEPMDLDSLPINIEVKTELNKDEIAMPPPVAPVPKPRRAIPKEKPEEPAEEETGKRRTTRTRKQTDTAPDALPVASSRSTRASSRATRLAEQEDVVAKEARPKRTRGKKKISDVSADIEKDSQSTQDSGIGSPAEKPRPKRTRRAQKAADKDTQIEETQPKAPEAVLPKEEKLSEAEIHSPILPNKAKSNLISNTTVTKLNNESVKLKNVQDSVEISKKNLDLHDGDETDCREVLDATKVIAPLNMTVTLNSEMDKTVVLPNGMYNHAPVTPKNVRNMNDTVVIETLNRETMVLDKPKNIAMDATVVLERLPHTNVTEDNSLLTDDSDTPEVHTPPNSLPANQPSSAVKEKVQQFEQLASRQTRTKTRAMAKKDEPAEDQTPPEKVSKVVLSAETLNKMNNLIFNGKATQISSSASKLKSNIPQMKSFQPTSASKLSGIIKAKEAVEDSLRKEKEDARRKKEAMLEAKRELQKRRREEKMAAAAAAREAAEKERQAAMEAMARERMVKQAHADLGKLERLKEAERKKQELARKVAETEERRKAEEQARLQRLAEEQKKAEAVRRKQLEEAEAMKKEEAIMSKVIEKRQKEYNEKQKLKLKMDNERTTPLKACGQYAPPEPVYMADGFQFLNSDSDSETPERPVPTWSTSKSRRAQLCVQTRAPRELVERLFGVRAHCPDLRDIFPGIERARLKRTSSAVWRTPPRDCRYKT